MRFACLAFLCLLSLACPTQAGATSGREGFDYFVLSLSWSPQFCATHADDATTHLQCAENRRRGFVAHGLWPQDDNGSFPSSCGRPNSVPPQMIGRMLAVMPSPRLIQHEWSVHGTCSGLSMDDYFDSLAQAFRKVQIPPPLEAPRFSLRASLERIKRLFSEANPGLTERMVTVVCAHSGEVDEVRICLDKALNFRDCGAGLADRCPGQQGRFRTAE